MFHFHLWLTLGVILGQDWTVLKDSTTYSQIWAKFYQYYRYFTNIFIALFFSVFRPLCSGSSITAVVNESGMVPSKWSNIIENWKLIGIGIEKSEINLTFSVLERDFCNTNSSLIAEFVIFSIVSNSYFQTIWFE